MELIRVMLRSDLRRRWRSWLALVVLSGLVGGVAMASVAGWARTTSAMDRFVDYHRPVNAYVETLADRDDIAAIDGVDAVAGGDYFLLTPVDGDGAPQPELLGVVSPFSTDDSASFAEVMRPIVVAGRLADPSEELEVMVDEEMADLFELVAGDTLTMQGYGTDQVENLFERLGSLVPTGEVFDFTVAGIIRAPEDVVLPPRVPDVVYMGSAAVFLGPAFDTAHRFGDVPSIGAIFGDARSDGAKGYELRVDFAKTSPRQLAADAKSLDPEAFLDLAGSDAERSQAHTERTIRLQATMLLALGVLVAVGGAVLVAQGLRRQLELDRAAQRSLSALGATRRGATGLALAKGILLSTCSVVLAWGVALGLSTQMPVGHARRAEIDPGVHVDVAALGLVGGALAGALILFIVGHAWRDAAAARRLAMSERRSPSGLSHMAVRTGMPAPVVAGVRAAALGAGAGTVAVTVFVAAAGIVGALGFSASEQRLATDPALWGWTFDAVVGDGNDPAVGERADDSLADNPMVSAYAGRAKLEAVALSAGGRSVESRATAIVHLKGTIEPRMLEGEAPRRDDEVALGAATARSLRLAVGDELSIEAEDEAKTFTVSGLVVMHLGFDAERIGEGVLLAPEGIERLGGDLSPAFVLLDYADGVDPDVVYAALQRDWGNTVLRPVRTLDVEQLHAVRHLPVWFSGLLGVVAAATLAFVLVLTLRRRRHELALLRTLGFEGRQLRTTVFTQALALVVPGAVLGGVAGVVGGRLSWILTARSMGAPEVPVVSLVTLIGAVAGSVLLAVGISAVPGRLAARANPARVLRAE